jgi:hypothetical protein
MARVAAIASLVVIGVIIADLVKNAAGTSQVLGATSYVTQPAFNALLGQPSQS